MSDYNKYKEIFKIIQSKLNDGEITESVAEQLNDRAYQQYVVESAEDDEEMIQTLLDGVKDKTIKLSKDVRETIKELIGNNAGAEDSGDEGGESEDE